MKLILIYALVHVAALPFSSNSAFAQTADGSCLRQPGPDRDADGVTDACELELATRFAPALTFSGGTCNLTFPIPRPAGGYLFGVQRVDAAVRIAYLPAYLEDCGWEGLKCFIPTVDCSPHAGDSEFLVVELQRTGRDTLTVSGIFLSAHCFGRSARDCRWYRGDDLKTFEWYGSSPVIWVAKGRNANYPTKRACDAGHHFLDTCDDAAFRSRFPIDRNKNIGSKTTPISKGGCLSAKQLNLKVLAPDAVECVWDPAGRFKGWRPAAPGVTGYYRYLTEIAGF